MERYKYSQHNSTSDAKIPSQPQSVALQALSQLLSSSARLGVSEQASPAQGKRSVVEYNDNLPSSSGERTRESLVSRKRTRQVRRILYRLLEIMAHWMTFLMGGNYNLGSSKSSPEDDVWVPSGRLFDGRWYHRWLGAAPIHPWVGRALWHNLPYVLVWWNDLER